MGGWDPMADDHKSRDFNSYQTGAGALMQAARDKRGSGGGGCINLFITYVPTDITKVLCLLCSFPPNKELIYILFPLSLLLIRKHSERCLEELAK